MLIDVSTYSGPHNSLNEHSWKAHSMSPVNLAEIQILEASTYDLSVIQIHGKLPYTIMTLFTWSLELCTWRGILLHGYMHICIDLQLTTDAVVYLIYNTYAFDGTMGYIRL